MSDNFIFSEDSPAAFTDGLEELFLTEDTFAESQIGKALFLLGPATDPIASVIINNMGFKMQSSLIGGSTSFEYARFYNDSAGRLLVTISRDEEIHYHDRVFNTVKKLIKNIDLILVFGKLSAFRLLSHTGIEDPVNHKGLVKGLYSSLFGRNIDEETFKRITRDVPHLEIGVAITGWPAALLCFAEAKQRACAVVFGIAELGSSLVANAKALETAWSLLELFAGYELPLPSADSYKELQRYENISSTTSNLYT